MYIFSLIVYTVDCIERHIKKIKNSLDISLDRILNIHISFPVLNLLNGSTFKKTCSGFAALFQEIRVSDVHCRIQRHAVANQQMCHA